MQYDESRRTQLKMGQFPHPHNADISNCFVITEAK